MNKHIEEMVKVLSTLPPCEIHGARPHTKEVFRLSHIAEHLYNAGYRKTSAVAREIFAEIEKETKNHGICYTQRKIAELKKKYESEGADDETL